MKIESKLIRLEQRIEDIEEVLYIHGMQIDDIEIEYPGPKDHVEILELLYQVINCFDRPQEEEKMQRLQSQIWDKLKKAEQIYYKSEGTNLST